MIPLLVSSKRLKDWVIDANTDDKILSKVTQQCQERYIAPLLGNTLYQKLLDDVDAETVAGDYLDLLDAYVIPALVLYVDAEIVLENSYISGAIGTIQRDATGTVSPDMRSLDRIRQNRMDTAEICGQKLVKYLKENSNLFPEYEVCGPDGPAKTAYTSGMNTWSHKVNRRIARHLRRF